MSLRVLRCARMCQFEIKTLRSLSIPPLRAPNIHGYVNNWLVPIPNFDISYFCSNETTQMLGTWTQ